MLAMSCQDVDLVRRLALVGEVWHKSADHGFTVSNRAAEATRLLAEPAKTKGKELFDEDAVKLQHLPQFEQSLGSFKALCDYNGKIMKARLKKKQW